MKLLVFILCITAPQFGVDESEPLRMTSPFLKYDIKTKTYFLEEKNGRKPNLIQGNGVIKAKSMWFAPTNDIGYAKDGVVFTHKKKGIILSGNSGEYDSKRKVVKVRGNAKLRLTKDGITVKSWVMVFYRRSQKAFFYGNVKIYGKNFSIKAKRARYDSRKDIFKAYGNVITKTTNGTIKSDRVVVKFRNGKLASYTATGNIEAVNSEDTEEIRAGYLYHNSELKYTRLEREPEIYLKEYKARVKARWIDRIEDENLSRAWGGVVVRQKNRTLYGREVTFYHDIKKAIFIGNSAVKEENNIFSSGVIEVLFDENLVVMKGSGKGFYEKR